MAGPEALKPADLCWRCDAAGFAFETTAELADLEELPGQDRAVEAIRLGLGLRRPGYNLFLLGPHGVGKHALIDAHLRATAERHRGAPDWCYVHDFVEGHRPRALRLPAGRGARLRSDMARLVESLRAALPTAFESDDYRTRRQMIEDEFRERQETALRTVQEAARSRGIALIRTPVGFAFAPVRDGQVVAPDAFQAMPAAERVKIEADMAELHERLQTAMEAMPKWLRDSREKLRDLNRETTLFSVGTLIKDLKAAYADLAEVGAYLDAVQEDVVDNAEAFLRPPDGPAPDGPPALAARGLFTRYVVNLLVGHGADDAAPVVYEEHPTYDNLLGRAEYRAEMGALVTDFTLIKPGALHRANGGYLVLDARKLLTEPFAYDGLKRALKAGEVRIESLAQRISLISTVSLEPEPIPLDVKVVLIGERLLYYLLAELDPEFQDLVKVAADFEERIPRDAATEPAYAQLVASIARRHGLKAFDRGAVARIAEFGAREAGDAERLSIHLSGLADVMAEADHLAGLADAAAVGHDHVAAAIDSKTRRHDRLRQRMQEEIERGTILIATSGATVGQINGLSVITLGGTSFGRPSRITARVRLGRGEVVDIEREVKLGGPLHSKGVLILAGYLGGRFGADEPLSLGATLVFEQSYGGVDGDSASSAELYALLSALAEAPIKQSFAVTGSVNQHGDVQAIGGVNEKIEGFFDLCAARGLDGEHGVLIPASNVKHLMLHRRVVEAVEQGMFRIVPVATIDQGIALLTGVPAGAVAAEGRFPADTINGRVQARLRAFALRRREYGEAARPQGEP
ncbi:MAG: ATP-binding protein [Alphaproteobacteria bacterium]